MDLATGTWLSGAAPPDRTDNDLSLGFWSFGRGRRHHAWGAAADATATANDLAAVAQTGQEADLLGGQVEKWGFEPGMDNTTDLNPMALGVVSNP